MKKHNDVLKKELTKKDDTIYKMTTTLEGKCQVIEGLKGIIEKYREEGRPEQLEEQIQRAEFTEVVNQLRSTERQVNFYNLLAINISVIIDYYSVLQTKQILRGKETKDREHNKSSPINKKS